MNDVVCADEKVSVEKQKITVIHRRTRAHALVAGAKHLAIVAFIV
jgi:hypothetical protein